MANPQNICLGYNREDHGGNWENVCGVASILWLNDDDFQT